MIRQQSRTYQQASKAIQDNLKKHLENNDFNLSDSDEESDDDSEKIQRLIDRYANSSGLYLEKDLVSSVVDGLKNVLSSSSCLICISTVKKNDQIWSCDNCYNSFHINCVQKWAKDSIYQQKVQLEDDPNRVAKEKEIRWTCPKCRQGYLPSQIPKEYLCYCKKVRDPKFDPWNTPHSCGEICGKTLEGCNHKCLLLCHPGPCPACPQTVSVKCHCGKGKASVKRCYNSQWSCGAPCGRKLNCKVHVCQATCHPGDCPPCTKTSVQSCVCGKVKEPRACSSPEFKCGEKCGKLLSCTHHSCDIVCHDGPCPPCPLSLDRSCPCGKSSYKLGCTEATPTCGDTCGKLLACGSHYCAERCHRGSCPSCLQMKEKFCKCGAKKKEMQCGRTFTCEIKCKKLKDCKRHPCNRKCCTGCQPCEQPCGKTLSCKNHKCTSRCHTGSCYPCQLYQKVSCNCGKTTVSVPCGREKLMKPPKCKKLCEIPSNCHHSGEDKMHNCHFGPCPRCKLKCGKDLPCGHTCNAECHENVKVKVEDKSRPVGPWEAKGPQFAIVSQPCPPCEYPVSVTCLGGHDTSLYPCHLAKPASCGRKCGRQLPCGNHTCARDCHKVRGAEDELSAGTNCKKCDLECSKPRPKGCIHPCSIMKCHPGDCPECVVIVKMKCHCGLANIFAKCGEYLASSKDELEVLLCCKDQCPKLMECGHRCSRTCHTGKCSSPSDCKKKVKITCKCKRKKEEFRCNQVYNKKENLVLCDESCSSAIQTQKENKLSTKETEEDIRNRKEAELFERQMQGGKKKRKSRNESCQEEKAGFLKSNALLLGSVFVAVMSVFVFAAFTY